MAGERGSERENLSKAFGAWKVTPSVVTGVSSLTQSLLHAPKKTDDISSAINFQKHTLRKRQNEGECTGRK